MSNKKYVQESNLSAICVLFAKAIYNGFEVPMQNFYYLANAFRQHSASEFKTFTDEVKNSDDGFSFVRIILYTEKISDICKSFPIKCIQPDVFTRKEYKDEALRVFAQKVVINSINNKLMEIFKVMNSVNTKTNIPNTVLKLSVFMEE